MNVAANGVRLGVLGGFELVHAGCRIALPLGAQRLLALLALQDGGVHRTAAAERLWPDSLPARAAANLRSALWRGRATGSATVIECAGPRLQLSPVVQVDLNEVGRHAQEILEPLSPPGDGAFDTLIEGLSRELLPGWSEDWLLMERERWDQIRLHTLEHLAQRLRSEKRYLAALQAALAAIAIEPIRETAHRIVIEVHADEGNVASAVKHYQRYRALLQLELGVSPSSQMAQLVRGMISA